MSQFTLLPPVRVVALALWADPFADWEQARRALRGEAVGDDGPARRPAPDLLPPAERRRAPDTVALALAVGAQAVAQSGLDPATLPSVFSSAHGDLPITDYLCDTLAHDPGLLSPTRFHHSVHNAASGYWTMAVGSHQPSVALAGYTCSFALGLLEAWGQAVEGDTPVLLVACDVASMGSLAQVTQSEGRLALALVLAPASAGGPGTRLLGGLRAEARPRSALRSAAAGRLAGNALADALPFLESMALGATEPLQLPLGPQSTLELTLHPPP